MATPRKKKVLINALHASTGGGLTYLRGLVGELAKDTRFEWTLLVPREAVAGWNVPVGIRVREVPPMGFVRKHMWEQLQLPFLAWGWGMKAMVCNANYAPLLSARALPILHTTVKAAVQAQSTGMKLYWRLLTLLTKLSLWNAPLAFSVSQNVVADYLSPKVAAKKVRIAPPGVTGVVAAGERDPNLVVTVGDFYPQKDYPTLVKAFQMLRAKRPGTRLMIIGRPVDAKVRDEVLALVRELKLADAVTLTGGMPHERLMQTLAKASVFVSTSKAETVQIPLLEAMASGVPVVAGALPHAQEFLREAGVLVPVDKGGDVAAAFAVALYGLLENHGLAEDLRTKGLARAKQFTWDATAKVIGDGVADVVKVKA